MSRETAESGQDTVEAAAAAALAGELVVLATDTVYGLGSRPDDPAATARVFQAKRRPRELSLPVLVPSLDEASRVAGLDSRAEALADCVWPGAVTLVLPRAEASAAWDLGGDEQTVGVRIPAHPLALAVLERAGPLAVTSANRSGHPTPTSCAGVREVFGDTVAAYACVPGELSGRASTVIDLAHGEPAVLRRGALDPGELRRLLA